MNADRKNKNKVKLIHGDEVRSGHRKRFFGDLRRATAVMETQVLSATPCFCSSARTLPTAMSIWLIVPQ